MGKESNQYANLIIQKGIHIDREVLPTDEKENRSTQKRQNIVPQGNP